MKRLLVTGATGFIGNHVITALTNSDFEIHAVSSVGHQNPEGKVIWHKADLHSASEQDGLMSALKPELLLHMAWYTGHGQYWTSVKNLEWIETSLALLRSFAANGGNRVVALGTCAEYDWSCGGVFEEETRRKPATLYGVCKNALFDILVAYCRREKIDFAWGRVFFPYGPGEPEKKFVSGIIAALLEDNEAKCTDGEQIRDFIYVKDLANAIVLLLKSDLVGAVNLGTGRPVKLKEIAETIGQIMRRPEAIRLAAIPINGNEASMVVADINKLVGGTGWKPEYDLHRGITETIRHLQVIHA